jgi:C-terminal processing protease CtpA/Prc
MSRFIDKELPYQKHQYIESYDNQPEIIRSWLELVSPRGNQYTKPVIILVGRWTGSMGEGIAVGFDGMNRAEIVGTEMKRLAGSDFGFNFNNQTYGYSLILERLYHINGTPREYYVPSNYVTQTTTEKDETLEKGIELINKMME